MRRIGIYLLIFFSLLLVSCNNKVKDYVAGKPEDRGDWFEPIPFGMVYVQRGSYQVGQDNDNLGILTPKRTVSIEAFWMDDTEITNNEYRQFIHYVRDSIARKLLGDVFPEYIIREGSNGVPLDEPIVDWSKPIKWKNTDYQVILQDMYIDEDERAFFGKELDKRKLIYDYYYIDYKEASKRSNAYNYKTKEYEGFVTDEEGKKMPIKNRRSFLKHQSMPVYPDTLCWIRDFAYTYNEPYTRCYFSHVAFDDYPLVGVTWAQANAFCHWRTAKQIDNSIRRRETAPHDYRLPTEVEWELAARGGHQNTMYPWGSYYVRNKKGCFVANFKPIRGNYVADSPTTTTAMKVGSFDPNELGLYDMAGNVAEWTSSAYYEASYDLMDDFNPEIQYQAYDDDPEVLKRKVIRGGSWKDIAYFIQSGTRTYEYQDSARSYIGFRCVRTSFRNELQGR